MSRVREEGGLVELTEPLPSGPYANADISPTPISARSWNWWHIAALWIGMSVCIPTYMLASGLISAGMNWSEAILTIFLGNFIVLVPMALNAHPGTKYGIPFPVLVRASFGLAGAHIPSIARALVACGWFGIQTWVGGKAIYELAKLFYGGIATWGPGLVGPIGINGGQLACFLVFWAMHMWIVMKGTESIKWVESVSAPGLILIGVALIVWAHVQGGGLRNVLSQSSKFETPTVTAIRDAGRVHVTLNPLTDSSGIPRAAEYRAAGSQAALPAAIWSPVAPTFEVSGVDNQVVVELRDATGQYQVIRTAAVQSPRSGTPSWLLAVFLPLLTAMVGYWATLSLNIPDFTRYAKSQKDQFMGQVVGLPTTMTLYSFVGIVSTCASVLLFPDLLAQEQAPWDPVDMLAHFQTPVMLFLAMFFLAIATLTTNIAANVVAPANSFSNLSPSRISFKAGGLITGLIGIVMMPWKLLENVGAYIFTWLIGYSALMGGIAGVMIADYYLLRRGRLIVPDLYRLGGIYPRWRWQGLAAFVLGVLPNIPGFLVNVAMLSADRVPAFFQTIYTYAWFVSFGISVIAYLILTLGERARLQSA